MLLLLVPVQNQLGGLQVDTGVHGQPFDEGGEGLLLLLVAELDLLDEFVQPQPDGGIGYGVQLGDLLERAGFENKIL